MADQDTQYYDLTKPEVGGSIDTWGAKMNTNMDDIDTQMKSNDDAAAAAEGSAATAQTTADDAQTSADNAQATADLMLPKAGGQMSGRVEVETSVTKQVAQVGVAGSVAIDAALSNYSRLTLAGDITTLTISNVVGTTDYVTVMIIDITSNGYEIDWSGIGTVLWAYGVAPTLSTTGGRDIVSLITTDYGTTWTGALSQPDCQ